MTTMLRTAQPVGGPLGLGAVLRVLRAPHRGDAPRVAHTNRSREFAAFPATRGIGVIVPPRTTNR